MARFPSNRISMLHFADEIELVPFDQPLPIPEGMSPITHVESADNSPSTPISSGFITSSSDSLLRSGAFGYSNPLRRNLLPLFHPAA
jgi:hypothetical protein